MKINFCMIEKENGNFGRLDGNMEYKQVFPDG
jgi:hypothetical protein